MTQNIAWEPYTKEELAKMEAQQQVLEVLARIGGRTLGVELLGDKK